MGLQRALVGVLLGLTSAHGVPRAADNAFDDGAAAPYFPSGTANDQAASKHRRATDSLVAYYSFDGGAAADDSGNGYDGTVYLSLIHI